jgi:hypothetical protein
MIEETFIWSVSSDAVGYALVCNFHFYVTKPKTKGNKHIWYTKEEMRKYRSMIVGGPIATINWTGKTFGMTEASEFHTEIYATTRKTIHVAIQVDERRGNFVEGISKSPFSVKKFAKVMKQIHEREQRCLENKKELFEKHLT